MAKNNNNVITYSAEFSVALDKLQAGFVETQKILGRIEKQFKESGQNTGTWFGEGLRIGLKEAEKSLDKAKDAAKTYADVTGDTAGAVRQTIQAHKDYIATLVKGAQAIGDEDGSIKRLIATHQKEIKALEKGKGAADGFGKGIKKGFDEAGKQAAKFGVNLVKSLGPVGLLLSAITAAVNFFKEKLGNAIKENEAAGASLDKLGKVVDIVVMPVFNALATILGKVADGVVWIADKMSAGGTKSKLYAADTKKAEISLRGLSAALTQNLDVASRRNELFPDEIQYLEDVVAAYESYLNTILAERAKNDPENVAQLDEEIARTKRLIDENKTLLAAKENTARVKGAAKTLDEELNIAEERNKAYKDEKQYAEERLGARKKYLDSLITEKVLNGDADGKIQQRINAEEALVEELEARVAALAEAAKLEAEAAKKAEEGLPIVKDRTALQEKMNEQLGKAAREAARIDDAVKRENFLREEQNRIYQQTRSELDGIIVKYGATADNAEKTFEFADLLDRKVAETTQHTHDLTLEEQFQKELAEADLAIADARLKAQYKFESGLIDENQLAEERNAAGEAYNSTLADLAVKYRNVEGAVEQVNKKIIDIPKASKLKESYSAIADQYQNAANNVLSITQRLADDQIDVINNLLEEQKELIDKQYEDAMGKLEEERQAALEAAGFVKTTTEEGLAASMEAALASGDEAAIYREKRRQEELAVNKKYDQLEKNAEDAKNAALEKAEKDAARKTADIQYKQAMAQWSLQVTMAPGQIAAATLEGYKLLGPLGGSAAAIIMGVVGLAQVGAILAAMPKKPAFKSGGIAGMPETYRSEYANGGIVMANTPRGVDAIDATLANREMVLNDDQQRNMFNAIASGQLGGSPAPPIVNVMISREYFAGVVVECINDGVTQRIEKRMIEQ